MYSCKYNLNTMGERESQREREGGGSAFNHKSGNLISIISIVFLKMKIYMKHDIILLLLISI